MSIITRETTPGHHIGTRHDPNWRRGLHEGACLALRIVAEGWSEAQVAAWLEQLGEWRFDSESGELPPEPKGARR